MIHCIFSSLHALREYLKVAVGIGTAPCWQHNKLVSKILHIHLKQDTASLENREREEKQEEIM